MTKEYNIPIFRAQRLDNDELVEGYYGEDSVCLHISHYITEHGHGVANEIKPETLAIHFPSMLDINGKPIFASLNKNGIGGDKLTDGYGEQYTCLFNTITNSVVMQYHTKQLQKETIGVYDRYWKTFKIIGVHL